MQPLPPHLGAMESGRTRQAFHARPMSTPIICLAGPTAAGKSAATLALARRWPIEIIVMDSATIYRSMDIGTAKPSEEEQARVPHHLLNIRDPAQTRSEEHTSELQPLMRISHAVFCLQKKKTVK